MLTGLELPQVGHQRSAASQELLQRKNNYVANGISVSAPIIIDEAKGAVMRDIDGNTYIDLYGGIGVINAGHCPETVVKSIQQQAEKLLHSCFMVTMYQPYIDLAEKLARITPGDHAKKAMFVNSGAEAVENAIKIAKAYTNRPAVIAFDGGFHGRTLLTMTLTSKVKPYKFGCGPFAPEVYKAPAAYCYRCPYKASYPDCGLHCLEHFERFFVAEVAAEDVAAMIIEPIQGEGGFIVPPKEFLQGLKKICEEHGIVFIADEVQSGFTRTGKMFAIEHFDVVPDLMTMAKGIAAGMPLSAVVGKAEIMDAATPGRIGGTFGGNPVSCAAALATIDLMEQENFCGKAEHAGTKLKKALIELQKKYPIIGDVRGLGSMTAIELIKDPQTKEPNKKAAADLIHYCFENGILIMGAGIFGNVIRFLPPVVISDEQLDKAIEVLENGFATLCK
ncbi:4-aminobutyrate--2-oxoglutarate transaminase [uncultured Desulfuromonas sp.]|uniref:4-aminobutyrate--2-oxoglutarate transaminase n=1 Tax=uncultured Desulfuromonas sp. TaxID=181013 RepID=UPI002AAA7602|nr:4-aminobutyrate--2-oxoglutarate transaminase [uncultured Desulfuromonas sp.]